MKKLIAVTFCVLAATALQAANYWQFPNVTNIKDTARMLIFNNNSSQNVTALQLKQEISAFARLSTSKHISDANQIFTLMTTATSKKLIHRASPTAGTYDRVMEIKNKLGKIVYYITQGGRMVFGTPTPLSVTSIYPANGATNISNGTWFNYSGCFVDASSATVCYSYWRRINYTIPAITVNKTTVTDITKTYIQGISNVPVDLTGNGVTWSFANFSGAPGVTYSMRFLRGSIVQTDGESSSSCGTAMTDVAGVCTSTFTMR